MLASLLFLLSASGAAQAPVDIEVLMRRAQRKLALPSAAKINVDPARRYRVADADDLEIDASKRRAFATDGRDCTVIGTQPCPMRTRTLFRSGQHPIQTLKESFLPARFR